MRNAVIGAAVVTSLVFGTLAAQFPGGNVSKPAANNASSAGMIAFSTSVGDQQQITIIDQQRPAIGVYHIDSKGTIVLKNMRWIGPDLQLEAYNATGPMPRDVSSQLNSENRHYRETRPVE
jgi:hypothetical protein